MPKKFIKPAKRCALVEPFFVMDILAKAKQMEKEGTSIIHMEVGEPDYETYSQIMDAANNAINAQKSHYTPALGLPELRFALAKYYSKYLSYTISTKKIAITPGASGAIQLVLSSIIDEGDEVILTDPGYPCNRHIVRLLSAKDINAPLSEKNGFILTPKIIEPLLSDKTKAVMIATPGNPTGTTYTKKQIKELADYCKKKRIHLIVDEIYQGIQYNDKKFSAAEISKNIWVINSFSKYFGMTGFRIGWLIAPKNMMKYIERLAQNLFLAPATIAQYAALEALSEKCITEFDKRKVCFKKRRDYLYKALTNLGFRLLTKPDGAFYLYADCTNFGQSSEELAKKILTKAKVAVTPGKDFSIHNEAKYIRFAYTTSMENLKEGITRLEAFLKNG